jgi:nucleoside-diphosphate-sugar epimerase
MHIVITGGAGFLGVRLARTLLGQVQVSLAGTPPQTLTQLTLVDRVPAPPDLVADPRVRCVVGDLLELLRTNPAQVIAKGTQAVIHLAAAVSGECEADLDLGLRSNLDTTRELLQRCRATGDQPVFVFSSSLAVFGNTPEQPLPAVISDATLPTPQNSYGVQKFMCEQLVADFGRKGLVQARNVRLMTVSIRPGKPNGAASSFLSGMIREPLAGLRANCPVAPDTPVALASPANTVAGLVKALECSEQQWGPRTAVNFPALTTTPTQMAQALARVAGQSVADRIDWKLDSQIADIVTRWPSRMAAHRAESLGLQADPDFDSIVVQYLRENPDVFAPV